MRRLTIGILLAALAAAVPARADTLGTTYVAPFTSAGGLGSSRFVAPCSVGASPVADRTPNAATGAIDTSEGLAARACRAASASTERRLSLGEVPAALAGTPARITAVLSVEDARAFGTGTGSRAASLTLAIGGARGWTLARAACSATCTTSTVPAGDQILEATVASLPATLTAVLSSTASLKNASGSVGVELRALLRSVTITPA